jgi:hypothetical protein
VAPEVKRRGTWYIDGTVVPAPIASAARTPPTRVAVVAVHGVADQVPGESAASVADLLVRRGAYAPSEVSRLALRVERVPVDARTPAVRTQRDCPPPALTLPASQGGFGQAFMRRQLEHYEVDPRDAVYDTVRVTTSRVAEAGTPDIAVDVHEVYWADLSRLGKGALQVFGELYQIIFHLGRLGHHSADHACRANGGTWGWRLYSRLVSTAVAVLTEPVPALNLLMLAIALTALPGVLDERWRGRAGSFTLAATILVLLGLALFRAARRVKAWVWGVPPLLLLAALVLVLPVPGLPSPHVSWRLVSFEASLIGFGLVAVIVRAYEQRRPGVLRTTAALGVLLAVILWWQLWRAADTQDGILFAGLRAAEIGGALLTASFTAIFVLALLAAPLGDLLAQWHSVDRHAALRATGTARIGLSIATGTFLVVTLTGWAGLFAVRERLIPGTTTYEPLLPWPGYATAACPTWTARAFLDQLLFGFVEYTGTLPAFALMAAALVLATWAVLPVALADVAPPRDPAQTAERYRTWLDRGFKLAAGSGYLLFAAVFVTMPFAGWIAPPAVLPFLTTCVSADDLLKAAALLGTAVVGVSVARGRFEHLALGLRPVVDVALDVDNHLREHPWRANPRARIAARYLSVLRALAGYPAVIIVAHSQGGAITADLLRFLHYEKIPAPRSVWLFTMGCPLRQLYSERFPQLYDWAARPDPNEIGVRRWVNAYRTGDYVGRALWEPAAPPAHAEDVCIGGGAHTHYWDGTSEEIGARLDALVVEAAEPATPVRPRPSASAP